MTIHLEAPIQTADTHVAGLAAAAQDMSSQDTLEETLRSITRHAQETFAHSSVAVALTAESGKIMTAAATDRDVQRAEALQLEWSEGPSLDALHGAPSAVVEDLRFDGRWRFWAPQAADLGFRSALTVGLGNQQTFGALALYSRRSYAYTADHVELASSFGQHVSVALTHVRQRSVLQRALTTQALVAQAEGILMERHGITADKAYQVLERFATYKGLALLDVAQHMVSHRRLPEVDGGSAA